MRLGMMSKILLIAIAIFFVAGPAHAGSSWSTISQVMTVIQIKNDREMQRIYKQIEEARRLSQRGLSADEIRRIREQAERVLEDAKNDTIPSGAMVFSSCTIVEVIKP